MSYRPQPLSQNVDIPPVLESLVEKLAVNVHDIWVDAPRRVRDGERAPRLEAEWFG